MVVLGRDKKTAGFTLNLLTWTDKLTLVTNGDHGDMTEEHLAKLADFNIQVINQSIVKLEGDLERKQLQYVRLDNGESLECDALFFNLGTEPASNLHEMLGCRIDEDSGLIWIDEEQQTSVKGDYSAGDVTPRSQLAIVAAAEGAMAAIHIHKSLVPESERV